MYVMLNHACYTLEVGLKKKLTDTRLSDRVKGLTYLLLTVTEEELIIPDPNKGKKALAAILRLKSSKRRFAICCSLSP